MVNRLRYSSSNFHETFTEMFFFALLRYMAIKTCSWLQFERVGWETRLFEFRPYFKCKEAKASSFSFAFNNFSVILTLTLWSLRILWDTVPVLSFRTDRSGQTVQTQIRLLLEKQSDQSLHCLAFHQLLLDTLFYHGKAMLFKF